MYLLVRRVFKARPLARDMSLYGAMFVGAELMQQTLLKKVWKEEKDQEYDLKVLGRYTFYGFVWYPVIYHYWYRWLDARFVGTSLAVVATKTLIDQFVIEPPLITSFYVGMSLMEGKEDITEEWRVKFLTTFISGSVFWLPVMAINFRLMPNSMRVIFLGAAQFFWRNFVSWYKRQSIE
ncbi:unnamed protein product, partial [Meganyctiphanes norvegica]